MSVDLSDYVEVSERVEEFHKKYPEGSLRCKSWDVREINGETFFIYHALAVRYPDDPDPGEGIAWEPIPGKTPYTKDSEAMNAETSAWGRAIVSLGIAANRGIASANEVRNRSGNGNGQGQARLASDKQQKFLFGDGNRPGLFDDAGIDPGERPKLVRWVTKAPLEELSAHNASKLIEALAGPKDGPKPSKAEKEDKAREWREALTAGFEAKDTHALAAVALATDLPADVDGLAEQAGLEEVPFE